MNRGILSYSTDMVFRTKGFDLTFSLEPADFEPAVPPLYDPFVQDGDKGPNGDMN